jgi:hypothetical protein
MRIDEKNQISAIFYFEVLLNMLEYVKYYVQITLHVQNFILKYC